MKDTRAQDKELLQQEIDINTEKQLLVHKRILEMKNFIKTLDKDDHQYFLFDKQILIEQIQLDELINEAEILKNTVQKLSKS